jgi:transposase InsO family protein
VALDDSSRYILAGNEIDAATGENSIVIVENVLNVYEWIRKVKQIITDRGSQYYANKKDKNGKVEKWHDLYEKQRLKFDCFADFVKLYNTVQYHESLDTIHYLQTPEDTFWSRL